MAQQEEFERRRHNYSEAPSGRPVGFRRAVNGHGMLDLGIPYRARQPANTIGR